MSCIATTSPTPAGPLPSARDAAATVDHRTCTAAQWNEAVLVRRMADAEAAEMFSASFFVEVRERIESLAGAERDRLVARMLRAFVAAVVAVESSPEQAGTA